MEIINKLANIEKKRIAQIVGIIIILVAVFILIRASGISFSSLTPSKIKDYLLSFGVAKGAVIYLLIYTFSIRPFVPIPPTLYTLAGGFTFGFVLGTVLTVTGATLNAAICFLLARVLGKDFVDRVSKGKFDKLNERLSDSGFKTLLLIRTSPIGPPFDLVSYVCGVLKISFWQYFFATLLGIIPATAVYSYFGGSITKGGWAVLIGFFLIVVVAVVVPWYLKRRKRKKGEAV